MSTAPAPPDARTWAGRDRPAIPDVVLEHLEEHGFLALQRRKLLFSTDVAARRLAVHDERIAAHWDGLAVNGAATVRLAVEKLGSDDPWELATAVRAWIVFGRPATDALLERWSASPPELAASWREALRGVPADAVETLVPSGRRAGFPAAARAAWIDALGWHGRLDPGLAREAARAPEPELRRAVARHGLGGEDAAVPWRALAEDPDRSVRRRAWWAGVRQERESGLEHLRAQARGPAADPFALRVLGLAGDPDDLAIFARAARGAADPAGARALADLGTPEAIDVLIALLGAEDSHARVATTALESALGPIPRDDAEAPATRAEAIARWDAVRTRLPDGARALAGRAVPWPDDPADVPCAWRWRDRIAPAVRASRRSHGARPSPTADGAMPAGSSSPWVREVPDGFFDDALAADARPGE